MSCCTTGRLVSFIAAFLYGRGNKKPNRCLENVASQHSTPEPTCSEYTDPNTKHPSDKQHRTNQERQWSRENSISRAQQSLALITTFAAIGAVVSAGLTYCASLDTVKYTRDQATQARRQADAVTTPYIHSVPVSHEDTSKEAYWSKTEPLFHMGGFDVSIYFVNFGQAAGIVYGAKCALFYGAKLKHVKEDYFRKINPDLAIKNDDIATMKFWRPEFDQEVFIVGSASTNIKSEELKCIPGVENAAGFGLNSAGTIHDIAKFIAMRGYYLKVVFRIEHDPKVHNECFRLILPNIPSNGISFQRKQNDCEDWDEPVAQEAPADLPAQLKP